MQEIANILKTSKYSTESHLYQLGYINCFTSGFHISEKNHGSISIWDSLLKCNENVLLLKQIAMGDKKWILHNNVEWKRLWGK